MLAYQLAPDERALDISIFVKAPYSERVRTTSRFWNASGISVATGASGIEVQVGSVPVHDHETPLCAHWCTFGLADAKLRSGVASASPSTCRDGQRRLPLDGPHETRRAAGAGRPGRTTG